jgi:parallel beta-helix repeat protein
MLRSVRKGGAIPTGLPLWLVGLALVAGALVAVVLPSTAPAGQTGSSSSTTATAARPAGHHRHRHRPDEIRVHPGESIQRAVNHAHPGDTILVKRGVYHESVQIKTNKLTLAGSGASGHGTVLKPKGSTHKCHDGTAGICVLAHRKHGERRDTRGTVLTGFFVKGFDGSGFFAKDADRTYVVDNAFVNDHEYGAAAFSSHFTLLLDNRAKGAGEAGFYVGDSPHAKAYLVENTARYNGDFGYFLRDSSDGVVYDNKAAHNCLGIGLLNTRSRGNVRNWRVIENNVFRNNATCEGEDGGPPISGTGIGLIGAQDSVVRENDVLAHHPKGPSGFPGGIVLASSKSFGGTNAAGNTITRNRAFSNEPKDIFWDGKGHGNEFDLNKCDHSEPSGLC